MLHIFFMGFILNFKLFGEKGTSLQGTAVYIFMGSMGKLLFLEVL